MNVLLFFTKIKMKTKQRDFILGSEWIYLKLYLGHTTADIVLWNKIIPLVNQLQKKLLIKKWFFVRYSDPDFHLRIRFLVTRKCLIGEILNIIYANISMLVKNKLIWKVQFDTYSRELERYGNKIEDIESFFYIDSQYTIKILKYLHMHSYENKKWIIALLSINSILSDFSLNIAAKKELMYTLSLSFQDEYGINKHNIKQLNAKYRENKKLIESSLNLQFTDQKIKFIFNLIQRRSIEYRKTITNICQKKRLHNYTLIGDLIHMNMNRLFCSHNRLYELIIYDFMYNYYNSLQFRNKI